MNIEEKFARGAETHTYLRIDSEFKVDVFLGYNDDGHMSIVIAEPGKEECIAEQKRYILPAGSFVVLMSK